MIFYAYFRRVVVKPRLIPLSGDAAFILAQIGMLMVSHFGFHGFHYASAQNRKALVRCRMRLARPRWEWAVLTL